MGSIHRNSHFVLEKNFKMFMDFFDLSGSGSATFILCQALFFSFYLNVKYRGIMKFLSVDIGLIAYFIEGYNRHLACFWVTRILLLVTNLK